MKATKTSPKSNKITELDTTNSDKLLTHMTSVLQNLATYYGCTVQVRKPRCDKATFTCFLSFEVENKTEIEKQRFHEYCDMFGLPAAIFGKTFIHGRNMYTVTGIYPNKSKFPVKCTRQDGKVFCFPSTFPKFHP